jgi:hypothetical protein
MFFAIAAGREHVLVYTSDGRFLRALGRRGDGPGEFGGLGAISVHIGPGDTVGVVDSRRGMSLFSPDLRFVRRVGLPATPWSIELLAEGTILMGGAVNTPAGIGFPFHHFRQDGSGWRSFGSDKSDVLAGRAPLGRRFFVVTRDALHFWSQKTPSSDTLEMFDMSGGLRNAFRLDSPWLKTQAKVPAIDTAIGNSRIVSPAGTQTAWPSLVTVDSLGRLWIVGTLPTGRIVRDGDGMPSASWNYVLEIIEPQSRTRLLSLPIASRLDFLAGSDLARVVNQSGDGVPVQIVRPSIRRN